MKKLLPVFLVLVAAGSLFAATRGELDTRIRKLMVKLNTLQSSAEKRIPADKLKAAKGVVLIDKTKGGFIFGYELGFGVAMLKDAKGRWTAHSMMTSNEGSVGAQIGGKNTFLVMLLMTDAAKDMLTDSKVDFGGEAGGTGGNSSGGVEGSFSGGSPVLVYSDASGVFGGAAIKGGSVAVNDKANREYYGQPLSAKDILFDAKVKPSPVAMELASKLDQIIAGK